MTARGYWRGHLIEFKDTKWYYVDTGRSVMEEGERICGVCEQSKTPEGHDPCLGTLPDVMNACCGHGQPSEAYVQFRNKTLRGEEALSWITHNKIKDR